MKKNIIVVDEQGNQYEATYPKRAKGLVKNGRARFVDNHTICLVCPPDVDLEDKTMSENKEISIAYLLEQIEKIAAQTDYLNVAIEKLTKLEYCAPECGSPPDERAKALGDIVRCRETTNQQLIAFYQKLYEDIKPEPSLTERKFALLEKFAQNLSLPGNKEGLALILQSIPSEEN